MCLSQQRVHIPVASYSCCAAQSSAHSTNMVSQYRKGRFEWQLALATLQQREAYSSRNWHNISQGYYRQSMLHAE